MKRSLLAAAASTLCLLSVGCGGGGGTPAPAAAATTPIKLPRTGQVTCYDVAGVELPCGSVGTELQDGTLQLGVAWPDPRFVPGTGVEEACLTDRLTGLMWLTVVAPPMPWDLAVRLPSTMTICGHQGWRLPNRNELKSLASCGASDTAAWLTSVGFVDIPTDIWDHFLWSSTTLARFPEAAWTLTTLNGDLGAYGPKTDKANALFVRTGATDAPAPVPVTGQTLSYGPPGEYFPDDGTVRAGVPWPEPRFTVGSGPESDCVTDGLTGLTWLRSPDPSMVGWGDAWVSVGKLAVCGHDDWRLPNTNELQSLLTFEMSPAFWLDTVGFQGIGSDSFWTSTTYMYWTPGATVPFTFMAYALSFANGEDGGADKATFADGNGYGRVWPVRGGTP